MTANLLYAPALCLSTFRITWRWAQGGTEVSGPHGTCKPFDTCHQYGSRLSKDSWSLASGVEWLPWVWAILPTQQDPGRGTWDLAKMLGDGSSPITIPFGTCSWGAVPACAQQAQPHPPCLSSGRKNANDPGTPSRGNTVGRVLVALHQMIPSHFSELGEDFLHLWFRTEHWQHNWALYNWWVQVMWCHDWCNDIPCWSL